MGERYEVHQRVEWPTTHYGVWDSVAGEVVMEAPSEDIAKDMRFVANLADRRARSQAQELLEALEVIASESQTVAMDDSGATVTFDLDAEDMAEIARVALSKATPTKKG